ncbi:TetR/AcrR family transcriptional regulator [Streptomyces sp. NPDC091271]|uniref:TetR/AcrR family transcriptional regulator n=1 Tax=Streptomyces sp. NPDC091271 TaxID=3365980 RepID=UPI0037F4C33D
MKRETRQSGSRGREQAAERACIIDAAYRVLAASEGASASVGDILAEAGLSTRAFYRHFGSKDDLVLAMFRRDTDRVMAELQSSIASAPTPEDALRRFVDGTLHLAADRRRRQRVLVMTSEQAMRARGYAAERTRSQVGQEAVVALVLEQGREGGAFPWAKDPGADARAICALVRQAFDEQISGAANVSAQESADRVVDFALRALGASPGGTDAITAARPERAESL